MSAALLADVLWSGGMVSPWSGIPCWPENQPLPPPVPGVRVVCAVCGVSEKANVRDVTLLPAVIAAIAGRYTESHHAKQHAHPMPPERQALFRQWWADRRPL